MCTSTIICISYFDLHPLLQHPLRKAHREFSLGVVGLADTTGIALAALTAMGMNPALEPYAHPRGILG